MTGQAPAKHNRRRQGELYSAWVTAREAFWIAIEALSTHKLRSFLTLLGVVIATTTLIVVMSVINGMNLYIAEHVANLGVNTFILSQYKWAQGYESWLKARRRNRPIRMEDYRFLEENLQGFKTIGATAEYWGRTVHYGNQVVYDVNLTGVTPSMIDIGQQKVDYGRYISDPDYTHAAPVCFIGTDLVDKFFPNVDPIGKEIRVDNQSFRVIGVAEKIGTTFGESQDNFVMVPLTAFQKAYFSRAELNVSIQAWSAAQMIPLEDEARMLMRVRRHLQYHDDDNFGINASETIMNLWQRLTGTIFAVTIGVVAVFMVVGGIVIMNIMLASVTDRTHEIGIRKSLGARRRDILTQFIIESAVMAGTGGVVGIVLAFLVNLLVQRFVTSSVPLSAVLVGVGLSVIVGLFFGIYPASKAARLDPIEALRAEV
ncbi:MAG: FtsX-like permease family protein [Acidobacteria bacterium]|nr:MAG: FtsX-like permease family protein [Acidobacteriota bacterium]